MKMMQKIIHAGFAMCALASASMPALSWTAWPSIDFDWHADMGQPMVVAAIAEDYAATREGHDEYPISSRR